MLEMFSFFKSVNYSLSSCTEGHLRGRDTVYDNALSDEDITLDVGVDRRNRRASSEMNESGASRMFKVRHPRMLEVINKFF